MKTYISEYEQQAIDFAEKIGLSMEATYTGHRARFGDRITAVYLVTLKRGNKNYSFEFSTSINDSWVSSEYGKFRDRPGLPPRLDIDKFFKSPDCQKESFTFMQWTVRRVHNKPSLYDVLACITHSAPGSFKSFCAEYGYDTDPISAKKTWEDVTEEWENVERLFGDVLDELAEIN